MIKEYTEDVRLKAIKNYAFIKASKNMVFKETAMYLCWFAAMGLGETWQIYEAKYNAKISILEKYK